MANNDCETFRWYTREDIGPEDTCRYALKQDVDAAIEGDDER